MPENEGLDENLLRQVAAEDIDTIPDALPDDARFAVAAVRAVAGREVDCEICVFVHSPAPMQEGEPLGFDRVVHMQTGHGSLSGSVVLTSRDANNGAIATLGITDPALIMAKLKEMHLEDRWTLFWEGTERVATFYPAGTKSDAPSFSYSVPRTAGALTQDEVCHALNLSYNDNMKTPTAHTVRLWVKGTLIDRLEDEIERHLNGQLSLYFGGKKLRVKILSQTNNDAGRADLIFLQQTAVGGPQMSGVLELKVLRGPLGDDVESAREGLSQGYHYRSALGLPFATLALYDVADPPSHDVQPLLEGQEQSHIDSVRVRRFPLYKTPKAWRDASGYVAT